MRGMPRLPSSFKGSARLECAASLARRTNCLTGSTEIHQVGPGPKLVSKVLWRILPFLLLCLVFHTLDRINIGFAALSMNSELGLGPFTFGVGAALGSVSYIMAEIPSNVIAGALWSAALAGTHHDKLGYRFRCNGTCRRSQ